MKVRVDYTINATPFYRRAIAHRGGACGTLATRREVREHLEAYGASVDDDLSDEYEACEECRKSDPDAAEEPSG